MFYKWFHSVKNLVKFTCTVISCVVTLILEVFSGSSTRSAKVFKLCRSLDLISTEELNSTQDNYDILMQNDSVLPTDIFRTLILRYTKVKIKRKSLGSLAQLNFFYFHCFATVINNSYCYQKYFEKSSHGQEGSCIPCV